MTEEDIGLAHEALAENETCTDPRAELMQAAACIEGSLRVYDPKHMPYNFEKATAALGRIRKKLAGLD